MCDDVEDGSTGGTTTLHGRREVSAPPHLGRALLAGAGCQAQCPARFSHLGHRMVLAIRLYASPARAPHGVASLIDDVLVLATE